MSRRVLTAGALAGVVLIGGGGVAYAQMQGGSGSYRTATVTTGEVDKTMNLSGTITSSSRRDLSFGASGKVVSVSVAAGDKVRAGEVLAKLDATDLKNAVTKTTATLASARAKLETDESSQSSTVATAAKSSSSSKSSSSGSSSSSKGSGSSNGSGSSKGSKPSPAVQKALAEVKKQQLAVTTAQTDATNAITAAKAALAAQKTTCADTTLPIDPTTGLSAECTTALDAVQAAQDTVAAKQDTLQAALTDLAKTLNQAIAVVQKAASSTPSGSASGSSGGGSTGSSGSSGSSSTGSSSTGRTGGSSGGSSASSLAEDQAAIDTAKAQLTEAKLAVDSATLTAPYAGRVLSASIAKGDAVGSSDTVMVLVGDGGTTATTTVTADQVASIKKGQTADVTPAGANESVSGTVTSIGLLPDSSSSTVTYPVTIDLADGVTAPEGTTASIAVITGTAKNALTIPSSALTKLGSRAIVRVLKDGEEQTTIVTVGVVGSTRTSITSGLKKGQTVVIADLDADLPSGGTTTNRFGGGANFVRPGGAGGGAFAGGGARGR